MLSETIVLKPDSESTQNLIHSKHGVSIEFPFNPYPCQIDYIDSVISALNKKWNAMLESPTGTGKTLCLLTSTLSWARSNRETFKGSIIYASRTHTQLDQAINELQRCFENHPSYTDATSTILASRQQLCINKTLKTESEGNNQQLIAMCKKACKSNTCYHKRQVETSIDVFLANRGVSKSNKKNKGKDKNELTKLERNKQKISKGQLKKTNIPDIEDLVKQSACPYYLSQELTKYSEVIFLPYNYLLDAKLRSNLKLEELIKDSIIILDEAHNINSICEELAGFSLSSMHLAQAIDRTSTILKACDTIQRTGMVPPEWECVTDEDSKGLFDEIDINLVGKLKEQLLKTEENLENLETNGESRLIRKMENGKLYSTEVLLNIFDPEICELRTTLRQIIELFVLAFGDSTNSPWRRIDGLEITEKVIGTLGKVLSGANSEDFRVYIEDIKDKTNSGAVCVNFWCFSAGVAMQQLMMSATPHSVIVTSGTLSPMDAFAAELKIPFGVMLSNSHVVSKKNLMVAVIKKGPGGKSLSSSYINRNDSSVKYDLCATLGGISSISPGGMLIFHPSYSHLKSTKEFFEENGSVKGLFKKPIFYEESGKNGIVEEFYGKIEENSKAGAAMFAVMRGKMSEGIDFSDEKGRVVCIVGVPFPPLNDPRIMIKQEYLDSLRMKHKSDPNFKKHTIPSGQEWYKQSAIKAVNQAIGRVIRHIDDFGVILLMDERFDYSNNQTYLSKWVREFMVPINGYSDGKRKIDDFFKARSGFVPKVKKSEVKNAKSVGIKRKLGGRNLDSTSGILAKLNKKKVETSSFTPSPPKPKKVQTHGILDERQISSISKFNIQMSHKFQNMKEMTVKSTEKMTSLDKFKLMKQNKAKLGMKKSESKKSETKNTVPTKSESLKPVKTTPKSTSSSTTVPKPTNHPDIDATAAKKLLKEAMRSYRDSNFNFSEFEKNASTNPKMVKMYKQVHKFFTAKGHDDQFEKFLKKLD